MFYICKKHIVVRLYFFLIVTPNIVKVICIKESMLPLKFTCIRVECDWILDCMKNNMAVIQQRRAGVQEKEIQTHFSSNLDDK